MAALVAATTSARHNGLRLWEKREGRFFGTSGSTRDGYAGGERGRDAIAFLTLAFHEIVSDFAEG